MSTYSDEASNEQNISIVLNGEESELRFISDRKGTKVFGENYNQSTNSLFGFVIDFF